MWPEGKLYFRRIFPLAGEGKSQIIIFLSSLPLRSHSPSEGKEKKELKREEGTRKREKGKGKKEKQDKVKEEKKR